MQNMNFVASFLFNLMVKSLQKNVNQVKISLGDIIVEE